MTKLQTQKCVPCEGGTKPLTRAEFSVYLSQIPNWQVFSDSSLTQTFDFKNFRSSMGFITQVALIAEKEGHHPDINLHNYKHVTITLSTHAIGGLSINDFIMATKIAELYTPPQT